MMAIRAYIKGYNIYYALFFMIILYGGLSLHYAPIAYGQDRALLNELRSTQNDITQLKKVVKKLERELLLLETDGNIGTNTNDITDILSDYATKDNIARLQASIISGQENWRQIIGKIEELNHKVNLVNKRFDDLLGNLDNRLYQLQKKDDPILGSYYVPNKQAADATIGVNNLTIQTSNDVDARTEPNIESNIKHNVDSVSIQSSALEQASVSPKTPQYFEGMDAKQAYDVSYAFIKQRQFIEAQKMLQAYIEQYNDSIYVNEASFWLAEAYYQLKDYVNAAKTYLLLYQQETPHKYTSYALYKLGSSLIALEKTDDACAIFNEYQIRYNEADEIVARRIEKDIAQYCQ